MRQSYFIIILVLLCSLSAKSQEFSIIGKWTAVIDYEGQVLETDTYLVFETDSIAWEINRINGKEERRYYVENKIIHLYDVDWIIETPIKILKQSETKMTIDMMGFVMNFIKKEE